MECCGKVGGQLDFFSSLEGLAFSACMFEEVFIACLFLSLELTVMYVGGKKTKWQLH